MPNTKHLAKLELAKLANRTENSVALPSHPSLPSQLS